MDRRWFQYPRRNADVVLVALAYVFLGAAIRLCYPFVDITPDSPAYISAAQTLEIGVYRPIGYSYFLRLLKEISPQAVEPLIYWSQFLVNGACALFLLVVVKRLHGAISGVGYVAFLALVVLNPAALFLTACVMSDSLFNSLFMVFVASGLWVTVRRSPGMVATHLVSLVALLFLRYSALVFPVLSSILMLVSFRRARVRLPLAALPIVVFGLFYLYISGETEKNGGFRRFSAFGGWQLANNALHVVPHVDLDLEGVEGKEIRFIHQVVLSTYPQNSDLYPGPGEATYTLLWDERSPLKVATERVAQRAGFTYLTAWSYMGRYLGEYGLFLIRRYPLEYLRYYVLPSAKRFVLPPAETTRGYSRKQPPPEVRGWLGKADEQFRARADFMAPLSRFLPVHSMLVLACGALAVGWRVAGRRAGRSMDRKGFSWLVAVTVLYSVTHILASPPVMRGVFIVHLPIALLLVGLASTSGTGRSAAGPGSAEP